MPLDPICGMFVRDAPDALETVVKGHRYTFCSKACLRRFTAPEREVAWLQRSAALALGIGASLLVLPAVGFVGEPVLGWTLFALGTAVQVVAGRPFYQGLGQAIVARRPNMDTLIVLGTTAAWLFGTVELLSPQTLVPGRQQYYFEVGALVLGFVSVGRWLEQRMRGEATIQVRKLLELQPATAHVLQDGSEVDVAVEDIQAEDVVVVRSGEAVPVDGVVLEGHGAVDEKLLTGEPIPVDKRPGDNVIAGSLNGGGELRVKATKVGEATALGHILALIGEAQAATPASLRFADRLSALFVPLVGAAALLTLFAWAFLASAPLPFAFSAAIAVLLVACPVALGLATPAALVSGVSKGAAQGIVVKDAEVLERIQKVDVVVFDKTGTLTRGEPELTDVRALDGDEPGLLALAASAEQGSEHPLAKTVVRTAKQRRIAVEEPARVQPWAGVGVQATVGRREVLLGNLRLMAEQRVDVRPADGDIQALQEQGKTVVCVAVDGKLAGLLAFSDPIRPEALEAVQRLQARKIEVCLVTGDNARTAQAVARQLNMRRSFAEITPHGKAAVVRGLQQGDHVVACVGDGINDAPALAAAHVGIAVGSGAHIAVEAGDLVLLRNDPRDVANAIDLSHETFPVVRQNLYWAFAYNVALIPIAAAGLLSPVLAGLAMAFSSVPVIANSVRIARANGHAVALVPAAPEEPARTEAPPAVLIARR